MPTYSSRRLVLAAAAEVVAFAAGAAATYWVLHWVWRANEDDVLILLIPLTLASGLIAAVRVRRAILPPEGKRPNSRSPFGQLFTRSRIFRLCSILILGGYAITWLFGVPAVLTAVTANDLINNAKAAVYYNEPWAEIHTGTTFAVPLLPGVILLYHYHIGGHLHGWGGWKLYLWYGVGQRQLLENVRWVT